MNKKLKNKNSIFSGREYIISDTQNDKIVSTYKSL